jgi:PadR family transcriptional regulator PadR
VYATLDRLEEKGLLSSQLGSGTPVRGRARRYYAIENAGIQAVLTEKSVLVAAVDVAADDG